MKPVDSADKSVVYSECIHDFSAKSVQERTGKSIAENETASEISGADEICRVLLSCNRLFVRSDKEHSEKLSNYLNKINIAEKIASPVFYKEILTALELNPYDFLLEPSEELVQDIRYHVTHTLDYACTADTFLPYPSSTIQTIRRGEEQFLLDDSFHDTMYCIMEQERMVSTAYFRPNFGVFDQTCSMQVFTRPDFRKKGYGKITASAATEAVIRDGKCALWVCQVENQASRRIAESLGYVCLGGELRIMK